MNSQGGKAVVNEYSDQTADVQADMRLGTYVIRYIL